MTKIEIANDYEEDIYATVYADKKYTESKGLGFGINVLGYGINSKKDKTLLWHTAKSTGYTKIKSKSSTKFFPQVDNDTIYVTLFCDKEDDQPFCLNHQVDKDHSVVLTSEGYICVVSGKKNVWDSYKVCDGKKPQDTGKTAKRKGSNCEHITSDKKNKNDP